MCLLICTRNGVFGYIRRGKRRIPNPPGRTSKRKRCGLLTLLTDYTALRTSLIAHRSLLINHRSLHQILRKKHRRFAYFRQKQYFCGRIRIKHLKLRQHIIVLLVLPVLFLYLNKTLKTETTYNCSTCFTSFIFISE